jgi:hypothetical protein
VDACRQVLAAEDMYLKILKELDKIFAWSKKVHDPHELVRLNDTIFERLEDEEYEQLIPMDSIDNWRRAKELLRDLDYGLGTRWILRRSLPVPKGERVDKVFWENKVQLLCHILLDHPLLKRTHKVFGGTEPTGFLTQCCAAHRELQFPRSFVSPRAPLVAVVRRSSRCHKLPLITFRYSL